MGLFDFISGSSPQRQQKNIAKSAAKLRNPHVQPQERQRVIEALTEMGTDDAISALLGRFTMRSPGAIVDEDEKRQVYESLLHLGEPCVDPIRGFIRTETSIYWPLRALTEISGSTAAVDIILEALDGAEDGYNTETERREQLVANLREFTDDRRCIEKLIEVSRDRNVEIRIQAIDGMADFDDPRVPQTLVERVCDEEETQRVKSTAIDILVDRRINVKGYREQLKTELPELFFLDDTGFVHRK